ncbi:hypothetical protein [Amycolatopsis sp. lyj-23]|uniref:hypothetical protein n=1 Tax=Amycolatopsis sp. lyj-23 TaxID=2789283 RepID=UPI00397D11D3
MALPSVRYKAGNAYRTEVNKHLIPNLGAHRVDKIKPEHFKKLYAKMLKSGLKAATAHQVHRTARTAFGEALLREHITGNLVELAKAPRVEEHKIEPFEANEIGRLLVTALARRNGVRFVLALGTRQGETIGLNGRGSIGSTRHCGAPSNCSARRGSTGATTRTSAARSTTRCGPAPRTANGITGSRVRRTVRATRGGARSGTAAA